MDASQWIDLINKVPRELHEIILVGLQNGMEITFQSVLRIEPEYLLVRGRISGTTEMGRVFCIPYDRLTYLHFIRHVGDLALIDMFGELLVAEKQSLAMEVDGEAVAEEAPAAVEAPVEAAAAAVNVRDRLRARLAGKPKREAN